MSELEFLKEVFVRSNFRTSVYSTTVRREVISVKLFISTGKHTASVSKKGVHVSKITKTQKPKKKGK